MRGPGQPGGRWPRLASPDRRFCGWGRGVSSDSRIPAGRLFASAAKQASSAVALNTATSPRLKASTVFALVQGLGRPGVCLVAGAKTLACSACTLVHVAVKASAETLRRPHPRLECRNNVLMSDLDLVAATARCGFVRKAMEGPGRRCMRIVNRS